MAEKRGSRRLARLMLKDRHRGIVFDGVTIMQKFETFAFSAGLILTGFLSLVALPLA